MAISVLGQIREALKNLNPAEVRELAERPFTIGLLAGNEQAYREMVQFLLPGEISQEKAQQAGEHVLRVERTEDFNQCDFGLAEPDLARPRHFYAFEPSRTDRAVRRFVDRHEELWIPAARHFVGFRDAVVQRLIRKIARENALFALATALPNIAPSVLGLPWAVGEFASDTALLTINQIRLAFLIAAASDAQVGYVEQRGQIASIITAAFGWRALAREVVSKIPFGGGLAPKALVAYAGTYVVGMGLERYSRIGRGLTADEKREQYAAAYERGREIVERLVAQVSLPVRRRRLG